MKDLNSYGFNNEMPLPEQLVTNSGWCGIHRLAGNLAYVDVDINGTSGAASIDLFNVTGNIEVKAIWGEFTDVTEVTSITAASFDFDDGAATVQLTSAAGTALSGATLHSVFAKQAGAATAVTFDKADQVRVSESATGPKAFSGAFLVSKSATTCQIRLTVTTDANTNATVRVYVAWVCRHAGSTVTPAV